MHFDAYRIKSEEWHTGTRINIKLILTIPYNNDDVDMDPSMGLVSNTHTNIDMGCITTMVSISMISCIMLSTSVLKYEVEVNDIIHKIDLNCLLKFNYYVNFKETEHKMIISIITFLTFRLESKSNRNRYGYP